MDLGEFKAGDSADGTRELVRLNLGCGKHPMEGWVNVDAVDGPGVDLAWDLDSPLPLLPFPDDSVDEVYGSHVIEHITNVLPLMDALYRVCRPDARATFACPYGSSDDAWENPTHVRPMFVGSWGFFGQPNYWREDYGYKGDWVLEEVRLSITPSIKIPDDNLLALWLMVRHDRNVVAEMAATLRCNKPARPPDRTLQDSYDIVFYSQTPVSPWEHNITEIGRLRAGVPE